MRRYAIYGVAAAAIVLAAVIGIRLLPDNQGVGGQPTPTPTPTSATTPSSTPTPVADPMGGLTPGTYVAHPFAEPFHEWSFEFDVPSGSWDSTEDPGHMFGVVYRGPTSAEGLGMGFLLFESLNGDPCTRDENESDVRIGPTVDDLVAALQDATQYDTSEPQDVTLGGYSGKKVVVTMPAAGWVDGVMPACTDGEFRIWNADGFAIYAQGPQNRWTMWILDVEGERVVVMKSDFADSNAELSAELDTIIESVVITPPAPWPPTPIADPLGRLANWTDYVAHPFSEPFRSMSFTFPGSDRWNAVGDPGQMTGIESRGRPTVAIGFLRVSSLNADPCNWMGTADDVAIGPTVDDLVSALAAETEYVVSDPKTTWPDAFGGYPAKTLIVTMPSEPFASGGATAAACDGQEFRIWNADGFDIPAQGPGNRWTLYIVDVEGERVVVLQTDFDDMSLDESLGLFNRVMSIEISR